MARVSIDVFGGIQPRLDPTSLGDSQATLAVNCRLHTTKLNPINQPRSVTDMPIRLEGGLKDIRDAKTIFIWQRGYYRRDIIAWKGVVQVAPSNINADNRWRLIVSGETGVHDENGRDQPIVLVSSPSNESYDRHKLYIPVPDAVKVDRSPSTGNDPVNRPLDPANLRYAYFFQTFVDLYGYESGLSPVDMEEVNGVVQPFELDYNDGDSVIIRPYEAVIPDGVKKRRIYKTVAGTEEDTIRLVHEQSLNAIGAFEEKPNVIVKDEDVGEEFPNITSIPPDLTDIHLMPGNFYVGFTRNDPRQICFSDINLPTSYPEAYKYSIRDIAIGIAVAGNSAFILTKGYPWVISGTDPNGMTAAQIVSEQACVSHRSICVMEGRVFYASQDGICVLSEGSLNSQVITRAYWDKVSWARLNPQSCIMTSYDNALFCWFTLADGSRESYIIDFDAGGNPIITTHDDDTDCPFVDVVDDSLYFVGA